MTIKSIFIGCYNNKVVYDCNFDYVLMWYTDSEIEKEDMIK